MAGGGGAESVAAAGPATDGKKKNTRASPPQESNRADDYEATVPFRTAVWATDDAVKPANIEPDKER